MRALSRVSFHIPAGWQGAPGSSHPPFQCWAAQSTLWTRVKKVIMEREQQYLWVAHKSGHCTSSMLQKILWFFLPILKQGHACHYANYHRWNTQTSKSQMPKPYLFGGMNIGLIKFTPSPAKHFLFTFINLPFTIVSRLLQSRIKTKGECTVVHGIEMCHQHGDFLGGKSIFPPLTINEFLMQTNYIASSKNPANWQSQQHWSIIR